jgi:hypothetical protein
MIIVGSGFKFSFLKNSMGLGLKKLEISKNKPGAGL